MLVHRSTALAALAFAAIVWPSSARAQAAAGGAGPPLPQARGAVAGDPSTYRFTTIDEPEPDVGLIASGTVLLLAAYSGSVVVGASSSHFGDDRLYVPIAGPWMDLATRSNVPNCGSFCTSQENANKALLIADGAVQGLGTLLLLGGFIFPEHHYVTRFAKAPVHLAPTFGRNGYGVSASGAF